MSYTTAFESDSNLPSTVQVHLDRPLMDNETNRDAIDLACTFNYFDERCHRLDVLTTNALQQHAVGISGTTTSH